MVWSGNPPPSIRFPGWDVRPVERKLFVDGKLAHVGSRAFDVLLALIEGAGQVVTKAELLDRAWAGLVVEENNVSVQIAALRQLLGAHVISTVPGRGYRLSAVALADEARPSEVTQTGEAAGRRQCHAMPLELADLVGREADIDAVVEQVRSARLVSIVGTGGIGKTALARAVFARLSAGGRDDAVWVDLAPLRDEAQLVPVIAKSLGIELEDFEHAREDLIDALTRIRALVVLDNCEHLLGVIADFVGAAVARGAGVRWLATSQERLHLVGEVAYRLRPLSVPATADDVAGAMEHGAIALLVHRAQAADREFVLDAGNLALVVDLCRHLDGLPLAIEMAAARVATLGLEGVHEQLGHRLRMLSGPRDGPPRQHTLESTFDWSYGLLSDPERRFFRRLEPFLGGFTAGMARLVAADGDRGDREGSPDWETFEVLGALVEKSLVHRDGHAQGRFYLFESARDYARQRLEAAGERDAIRHRHAHVVAAGFRNARADLERMRDDEWAARYGPEQHNVHAALSWACETGADADVLARLIAASAQIDTFSQARSEILQFVLPMDVLASAETRVRSEALLELSWAHYLDGSRETGTALARRALEGFEATRDVAGTYRALAQLARLYESRPGMLQEAHDAWRRLQEIEEAQVPLRTRLACTISAGIQYERIRPVADLEELEGIALRAGFTALASVCRVQITDRLLIEARFDAAVATVQRFVDSADLPPRAKGLMLANQVLGLVQLGRVHEARAPALLALRTFPGVSTTLVDTFALAAARQGQATQAALLAGYGARARELRDERPDPAEAQAISETAELLDASLPAARKEELLRMGASMSSAEILAIALPAG